jgi:hypothetical protein
VAMGVLCAASQAALGLATSKVVVPPAGSSTFLCPGVVSGRTARIANRELRGALKGGLSEGLGRIHSKRGSRLSQPLATTESSEVVEEQDVDMNSAGCETLCATTWGLCDTVIGVLGGGQLGRMLCQAASPMGVRVSVLDPLQDCPAGRIAYHHQVGSFKDMQAVREFAKGCGALTVEIEHVDVETLESLARENVDIEPKPFTIRIIQVSPTIRVPKPSTISTPMSPFFLPSHFKDDSNAPCLTQF